MVPMLRADRCCFSACNPAIRVRGPSAWLSYRRMFLIPSPPVATQPPRQTQIAERTTSRPNLRTDSQDYYAGTSSESCTGGFTRSDETSEQIYRPERSLHAKHDGSSSSRGASDRPGLCASNGKREIHKVSRRQVSPAARKLAVSI